MKEEAIDNVSIDIEYPRPFFDFPDLSSENGNTTIFWKQAETALNRQGFKVESSYIHNKFLKMTYKDLFDYLYRFLDFTPKEEVIKEDENSIYIKIDKHKIYSDKDIKQPLLFNIKHLDTIKSLYEEGEDFSIKNCYNRNIFHYITDVNIMKYLLDKNQQDNFIDLFDLDVFNSSVLFTHNNPNTFILLLEDMHKRSPIITQTLLTGTNVFNENALGVYLHTLDTMFSHKKAKTINIEQWNDFSNQLIILKKTNPELTSKIISALDLLPVFENNPELKKLHLYTTLNTMMPTNENIKPKKSKL